MTIELSENVRLIIHAALGAMLGFVASCIFLILYYGTTYTIPVTNALRFSGAFWSTFYIMCVVFGFLFIWDILAWVRNQHTDGTGESDETE